MSVRVRLFASAREAAGTSELQFDGVATVGEALDAAVERCGGDFAAILATSRVWLNGDEPAAGVATPVAPGDEVAVLPPVSGGA